MSGTAWLIMLGAFGTGLAFWPIQTLYFASLLLFGFVLLLALSFRLVKTENGWELVPRR